MFLVHIFLVTFTVTVARQQSYWILTISACDLILHVINYLTFCNALYRLVTDSVLFQNFA